MGHTMHYLILTEPDLAAPYTLNENPNPERKTSSKSVNTSHPNFGKTST
jgi:hypothetical protein